VASQLPGGAIHDKSRRKRKRRNGHPKMQKSGRKHQSGSKHQNGTMDLSQTIVWIDFG